MVARLLERQLAFDAQWNAHDEAGILAGFSDEAIVRLSPPTPALPELFRGKDEIAAFVRAFLPGFHVQSTNQVADEGAITWMFAASCDAFRRAGIARATGSATARLLDDRIVAFQITFDEATTARLAVAAPLAG
jgi:hypothetical protein